MARDSNAGTLLVISASDDLGPALEVIESGGIIAFPTETSYGLGADPYNEEALKRLFSLKGRPLDKPLSLLAGDMDMVRSLVTTITPLAQRLIKKFWPGPLTLVLEAAEDTPSLVTSDDGGKRKIGIRISSHPLCHRLLLALGRPLTATSANPAGMPPALDAAEVKGYFGQRLDLVIDSGRLEKGQPSTIVDARGPAPLVLREGRIKKEEILARSASLD